MIDPIKIEPVDWPKILDEIYTSHRCLTWRRIASLIGRSEWTVTKLRTGEIVDPKHSTGSRIVALHEKYVALNHSQMEER